MAPPARAARESSGQMRNILHRLLIIVSALLTALGRKAGGRQMAARRIMPGDPGGAKARILRRETARAGRSPPRPWTSGRSPSLPARLPPPRAGPMVRALLGAIPFGAVIESRPPECYLGP